MFGGTDGVTPGPPAQQMSAAAVPDEATADRLAGELEEAEEQISAMSSTIKQQVVCFTCCDFNVPVTGTGLLLCRLQCPGTKSSKILLLQRVLHVAFCQVYLVGASMQRWPLLDVRCSACLGPETVGGDSLSVGKSKRGREMLLGVLTREAHGQPKLASEQWIIMNSTAQVQRVPLVDVCGLACFAP